MLNLKTLRKERIINLLLFLTFIYIGIFCWGVNKGFDLVDEGFYLIKLTTNLPVDFVNFQFLINPFKIEDAFTFRLLNIIALCVSHLFLGYASLRFFQSSWLRIHLSNKVLLLYFVFCLIGALFFLNYYPNNLSYNSLNSILIAISLSFFLFSMIRFPKYLDFLFIIFCSITMSLLFYTKFPTFFAILCIFFLGYILQGFYRKGFLFLFFSIIAFIFFTILTKFDLSSFKSLMIEEAFRSNQKTGHELLAQLKLSFGYLFYYPISIVTGLILGYYLEIGKFIKTKVLIKKVFLGFFIFSSLILILRIFPIDKVIFYIPFTILASIIGALIPGFLIIIFFSVLVIIYYGPIAPMLIAFFPGFLMGILLASDLLCEFVDIRYKWNSIKMLFVKNKKIFIVLIIFFLMPISGNLGTNNNFAFSGIIYLNFILIPCFAIYFIKENSNTSKFLYFLIFIAIIFKSLICDYILKPYDQISKLQTKTEATDIYRLKHIRIAQNTYIGIQKLKFLLAEGGYNTGDNLLAFYNNPGLIYLLEGNTPILTTSPLLEEDYLNYLKKISFNPSNSFLLINQYTGNDFLNKYLSVLNKQKTDIIFLESVPELGTTVYKILSSKD
jgi:hypothetical protein